MGKDTRTESCSPPVEDGLQCYCQSDGMITLLSRKYAIQTICVIGALEPVRYAEIEATLETVSSSTLSTRLDELTEAGVVDRERYAEIPPRVEYRMTEIGEELCHLLEPLLEWTHERERPQ